MLVYRIEHRTLFAGPWMWVALPRECRLSIDWEIRCKLGAFISSSHGRFFGFYEGVPIPRWRFAFSHFDHIPSVFFDADVLRHFRDNGFVLREYDSPIVRPTNDEAQVLFDTGRAKLAHTFDL